MRERTIIDILEKSVEKWGKKNAIMDEYDTFTYEELQKIAQCIGINLLHILGGKTQKPIMLFMDKSCKCLLTIYGVLYSGNIYVPMDIKTPAERIKSIFETLGEYYVITTIKEKQKLDQMGITGQILIYENLLGNSNVKSNKNSLDEIRNKTIDTHLMYILFTSGSTGSPKGVAVMHRSVLDYIDAYIEQVPVTNEDIFGNQTPFYADMSLKDICMAVKVGACLCIIPQKYFMVPKKLLAYLEDKKVTCLAWVPTAYRIVAQFNGLSKIRPKYLRTFVFSGEAMPTSVFNYWRKYYPEAIYIQQYGPTEITGACTSYTVEKEYSDDAIIPIGKAFGNTGLLLLDEMDHEIKQTTVNQIGEICVFGTCLSAGYYNNKEKTDEVFVQNPLVKEYESKMYRTGDLAKWDEDGNLVFVTRKDFQIKHMGKRIELGEIEAAIQTIDEIAACCCTHNKKKDALALYYIGTIDEKEIIQRIQCRLPQYMIPTIYHKVNELPILPNGKLDRKGIEERENF